MKKQYEQPIIELSTFRMTELLANDNIMSDPWGYGDDPEAIDEME